MTTAAADLIRERIRRQGPIRFDEYLELALYAPDAGFYETGGARRSRRRLPHQPGGWAAVRRRPRPRPRRLVGAPGAPGPVRRRRSRRGPGRARGRSSRRGAGLRARAALCAVERSAAQRASQPASVELASPAHALGPVVAGPDGEPQQATGDRASRDSTRRAARGAVHGSRAGERAARQPPVPPARAPGRGNGTRCSSPPTTTAWRSCRSAAPTMSPRWPTSWRPARRTGRAYRCSTRPADWLRAALAVARSRRVAIVDYADTTTALAARPDTMAAHLPRPRPRRRPARPARHTRHHQRGRHRPACASPHPPTDDRVPSRLPRAQRHRRSRRATRRAQWESHEPTSATSKAHDRHRSRDRARPKRRSPDRRPASAP